MKTTYMLTIMILWLAASASAEIYQYKDDKGVSHYTDEFSRVPVDKQTDVEVIPEIPYDSSQDVRVLPYDDMQTRRLIDEVERRRRQAIRIEVLKQRKEELEKEYQELLAEKSSLDNNKSFQKRRMKKKYKHRSYIRELIKKEQRINDRSAELEAELKEIESQL